MLAAPIPPLVPVEQVLLTKLVFRIRHDIPRETEIKLRRLQGVLVKIGQPRKYFLLYPITPVVFCAYDHRHLIQYLLQHEIQRVPVLDDWGTHDQYGVRLLGSRIRAYIKHVHHPVHHARGGITKGKSTPK